MGVDDKPALSKSRRPISRPTAWQSWDTKEPALHHNEGPASGSGQSHREALLRSASAPRIAPTAPRLVASGLVGANAGGNLDFSQRKLQLLAGFEDGYEYSGRLGPGNSFFAALEAAVLDVEARGEKPLPVRLLPTLVFGLLPLGPLEGSDNPLWLWSDLGAGGGLRCMRKPVESMYAALEFLAGTQAALAIDKAHLAELSREEMDHVDRTLGSLVAVQKQPSGGKSSQLRLLTLRGLESLIKELKSVIPSPGEEEGGGGGGSCLQRYIHPTGLTASCVRVQYRNVLTQRRAKDVPTMHMHMQAFNISSGVPAPRGVPECALGNDEIRQLLTACRGAPQAKVHMMHCRGREFDEVRTAMQQLTNALRRVTRNEFEEIVLEIIRLPGGGGGRPKSKPSRRPRCDARSRRRR